MKTWYYLDKQNQEKQTLETQFSGLLRQEALDPNTLVWTEGMPDWAKLSVTLPELFDEVAEPGTIGGPPPLPGDVIVGPAPGQHCHEVDYEIFGDDMQIVEVELDPGEKVIAEAGAMNYMEPDISFEAKMGDGSKPVSGFMDVLKNVGKRMLTGESIFLTHFTHEGRQHKRRVAFAAPYPGKIIPINLAETQGMLTCQKDAFLAAAYGTEVTIAFQKRLGAGFFGGEGFILQKLRGDGMAFLHAGGTIVKRELTGNGEKLRVDTGCIVAFTGDIEYDIEKAGNLKSMFFGGEGLFLATLQGRGTVYLQSLPFSRLADRILRHAPSAGGRSQGEGSMLGGIGRMLDGN